MSANERRVVSGAGGWSISPGEPDLALVPLRAVPASLRATVALETSVTEAIAARYGEAPMVTVEFEGDAQALAWEAELLGIDAPGCRARHVSLWAGGEPVVHARSLAPASTRGDALLRELGTRALGSLLFTVPAWTREGPVLPVRAGVAYGRVSLWRYGPDGGGLLVTECFAAPLTS